jgi:hypothetical protein
MSTALHSKYTLKGSYGKKTTETILVIERKNGPYVVEELRVGSQVIKS